MRPPTEGPPHYGIETGNLRRNLLSLFNNIFFCLNGYKYVFKQYNSHGKVLEAIWVLPGTSSGSSTASLEGSTTTSNLASCQHLSLTSLWLQGIWIHFLRSHNPLISQICCQGPPVARQLHPLKTALQFPIWLFVNIYLRLYFDCRVIQYTF